MGSKADDERRAEERPAGVTSEDRVEAKIDRDLNDSFPASDPPGWVLGVRRHPPEENEEEGDAGATPSAVEEGE
ncbi:MAG TPA: hypothetical protein VFX96_12790 [Pyrinomonadaceae bacterium]|nr:hypothetical protein [Pyrinomonadaceae bacterium]